VKQRPKGEARLDIEGKFDMGTDFRLFGVGDDGEMSEG
jgi:hypothetical protein